MDTKNIVKGASIVLAVVGLLAVVSSHPVLVAMIVVGVAGFYVADRML